MGNVPNSSNEQYFTQKIQLGAGSHSKVWRGIERDSGKIVAIKELSKSAMHACGRSNEDIEREMQMMTAVKHRNILEFLGKFEDYNGMFLAVEYCDGGDFGDKVRERGMDIKETEAADWVRQICCAIQVLHCRGICHRDIKPDNFLVAGSMLKLSDFGLACFVSDGQLLSEKVGTPAFMSPEQIKLPNSPGYSRSCDMWAAGIAMYMLMFGGRHPFFTNPHMLDCALLVAGKLEFRLAQGSSFIGGLCIERFSSAARELCSSMVQPDPAKRISAQGALQHPWLCASDGQARVFARGQTGKVPQHTGDSNLVRGFSMLAVPTNESIPPTAISDYYSRNACSLVGQPPTQRNDHMNGFSVMLPPHLPQARATSPSLSNGGRGARATNSGKVLKEKIVVPRMSSCTVPPCQASPIAQVRTTSENLHKQVGQVVQPDMVASLPRFSSRPAGVPLAAGCCRMASYGPVERIQSVHSPRASTRATLPARRSNHRHNTLPANFTLH